jgi:hypothetical protein
MGWNGSLRIRLLRRGSIGWTSSRQGQLRGRLAPGEGLTVYAGWWDCRGRVSISPSTGEGMRTIVITVPVIVFVQRKPSCQDEVMIRMKTPVTWPIPGCSIGRTAY